jgi:uncharacterized protein
MAFNVMSKPAGPACNMACDYCFYRHNQKSQPTAEAVISDELLERFIAQYIQSQDNLTMFFAWQGGEPTLAGLDFYRKVVALQQKHARKGIIIANAFQTNGLLLDDQWCAFLAEHRFAVGISIDGPGDIHDAYRRTRDGGPTFDRIRKAVDALHKHKVRFDTLTTITPDNVHRVAEVYDFLTRELGSKVLQFQPCVERKDYETVAPGYWPADTILPVGDPRTLPRTPDSILTDWSISAQDWGQFLCELFDRWWERDRDGVIINWIHSWASQFAGGTAMMCICSPICGRAVSMEKDGRVYSCDHLVYPQYCLGQVSDDTRLSDLVRSSTQRKFGEAKSRSLPAYCRRCHFLSVCYGECPKRRFLKTPDGEPGLNYLCPGYRAFFNHAASRLSQYGQRLMGVRPPTSVSVPVRRER